MAAPDGHDTSISPEGQPDGLPLVGAVVLLTATVTFALSPLLPVIGLQLEMSAGSLGMITAALAAGRLITDLPAGNEQIAVVDRMRIQRRAVRRARAATDVGQPATSRWRSREGVESSSPCSRATTTPASSATAWT